MRAHRVLATVPAALAVVAALAFGQSVTESASGVPTSSGSPSATGVPTASGAVTGSPTGTTTGTASGLAKPTSTHGIGALPTPSAPHAPNAPNPTGTQTEQPTPPDPATVDCTRVHCIALTFDDGPGPYTAHLLQILRERRAPATFYLIGASIAGHEDVVRQIRADGHEIGTHTWSHPALTGLGADAVRGQLTRGMAAIHRALGVDPTTMRPPYGAWNGTTRAVSKSLGLAMVGWDVDTADWRDRDPKKVLATAMKHAHPGASILMHDIHPTTVAAVPALIDALRAEGYVLVPVSRVYPLKTGQHYGTYG